MNCKQDDLAIYVCGGPNQGKIVRCVNLVAPPFVNYAPKHTGPVWLIDPPIHHWHNSTGAYAGDYPYVRDGALRPLRDNGEPDEIVMRVPKPQPTKENV